MRELSQMITNGRLARELGVDPKTLRKWAKKGLVPSHVNRLNNYRYYFRNEVYRALKDVPTNGPLTVDQSGPK